MRELDVTKIRDAVCTMVQEVNYDLPADVLCAIKCAKGCERNERAAYILDKIEENIRIAGEEHIPLCQDTGLACVFLEIGQEVALTGGYLYDAVNEGVRRGYTEGYLRKSVVKDPLRRQNTGDNTPAMLYTEIVPGDKIELTVAPKGFGSENMSKLAMLKPSPGLEGVRRFVLDTVREAGPNPCPPVVVGVGIGGDFERCAELAKKALCREIGSVNPDPRLARLEEEWLTDVNELGIGVQGFGGPNTAIGLFIEEQPCHFASLPVAVNLNCHCDRSRKVVL